MMLQEFDISGRRALITGGGDGLGVQMTEALVEAGAHVVICGRRIEPLQQVAGRIGDAVTVVQCDVTVPEDVDRLVSAAGDIDILVNNAGLAHRAHWTRATSEDWRWIMALNVESPMWLMQRFVPGMIERGWGRVINVSSVYGLVGGDESRYPGIGLDIASYFASKHGLIGLTKFMAAQLGTTGVTVNALCPGMFPSPANVEALQPAVIEALEAGTPMKRMGAEGELRAAVLFLAGPGSSFVTGQNLVVDGGWTIW